MGKTTRTRTTRTKMKTTKTWVTMTKTTNRQGRQHRGGTRIRRGPNGQRRGRLIRLRPVLCIRQTQSPRQPSQQKNDTCRALDRALNAPTPPTTPVTSIRQILYFNFLAHEALFSITTLTNPKK